MKRQIPLALVIILGFSFVGYAFIPHKIASDYFDFYNTIIRAISPFAMLLGIYSLTSVHVTKIKRKLPNWQYSLLTLISFFGTALIGFIWGTQKGSPVLWVFENIQMPMSATMFALLAFYIASAAYKSFRARSVEATVLLVAAAVVMLGQVSFGAAISNGLLPIVKDWILNVPNLAAKRGIALGVGLGGIATALKILLGIERTYLGAGD